MEADEIRWTYRKEEMIDKIDQQLQLIEFTLSELFEAVGSLNNSYVRNNLQEDIAAWEAKKINFLGMRNAVEKYGNNAIYQVSSTFNFYISPMTEREKILHDNHMSEVQKAYI